jgi:bis(5'-nucleosyl)-tetraphosphatase (symmetrical)
VNPPVYAIGDIQGCCASLEQLIGQLPASDTARLWFVGDLINRGPQSLQTLRLIRSMSDRVHCVLGNHDLHLLAAAAGVRKPSRRDTLDEILSAPDSADLIDWLRKQPLVHYDAPYLLAHAGIHPDWTLEQTLENAQFVERQLRSPDWRDCLADMYGNAPDRWQSGLTGSDRTRVIINSFTRMRMLDESGGLDMEFKDHPDTAPAHLSAWFNLPNRLPADHIVVFGHWSTLGLMIGEHHIATDSGCVWGGALSAVQLGDHAVHQVSCQQAQAPGEN